MGRRLRTVVVAGLALGGPSCTFNFDVTSQRTALENQVMGSYRELEDDLILVSSVRGNKQARQGKKGATTAPAEMSSSRKRALDARQNQDFNRDDIEELKDKGILGEAADWTLVLLGRVGVGQPEQVTAADRKLADALVGEENGDRVTICQRAIAANPNLKEKDLPVVRKTYARIQQEKTSKGQWFQSEDGKWEQKL